MLQWWSDFLFMNETLLRSLAIDALLAYSLYITFRAGMWNLAQGGAMAIAGYTVGILYLNTSLPVLAIIALSVVVATVLTTIIVSGALRLEGPYLAIATIAFVELARVVAINLTITGGPGGLSGLPSSMSLPWILVALAAIIAATVLVQRSRIGTAIRLHRNDPVLAEAVGVNVKALRLNLLAISSVIAGVGAALAAFTFRIVQPATYDFGKIVELLTYVIVGGTTSIVGPVLGLLVIEIPTHLFAGLQEYRLIVQSAFLLLAILFFPKGLASLLPRAVAAMGAPRTGGDTTSEPDPGERVGTGGARSGRGGDGR